MDLCILTLENSKMKKALMKFEKTQIKMSDFLKLLLNLKLILNILCAYKRK